ncbi:MAG: hypothetical protein QOG63_3141 [Thermoleophilaceae bacterium]|nr:hypothetical protein [Thermoleophilaceae bacterium]
MYTVPGVRTLLVLSLALLLAGCGSSPARVEPRPALQPYLPDPDDPLPRSPRNFAEQLTSVSSELRGAINDWRASDPPAGELPPREVQLRAVYQQRSIRRMARGRRFARDVLPRLPGWLRADARAETAALHGLYALSPPVRSARGFKTRAPLPPGRLLGFYRSGERRFGVRWHVLAAVNLVGTVFGRLRNRSTAGARGPMQLLPSTWRAYGLGGDIGDPHDAILGAANYLHSSGAPGSYSRALYAYTNSSRYVRAVLTFARRMRADPRTYYALWSWQVFVRTRSHGDARLTSP